MEPALVLLHGFTQTRQSWRRTAQALQGRYRALVPDLPGHGQAAHRTPSFDACAAYVRALSPARTFTLAGYSMGGRIALHTALTLGPEIVTRLVLVGASPGLADPAARAERRAADDALADRLETLDIETFAREWGSQSLFAGQPERVAAAAYADRLRNTPQGLASALRGLGTGVMEPLWERLGELAIPVTLVVGERDAKFRATAEAMLARLPNARLVVVEGAGHAVQLEMPAAVADAIYQSLSSSSASA
ncbi:2-succinyl-6-hydroxy-2,4-cyclohexadiene-1-carboxylate synthase [Solirubrobacter ginsenosidimutans]|uniref:Putative 2-succinyl-6-hydroxy-2,4-cyclohexadiene-1-carboxylate synthase n=1 Tax=Solirubrobacter ginsenosidimutans TaxID=490573 RepID=A0A9X3S3U3_9ACTN|nr:2-succinyl-6-hydroxy-2,4-cyclohexadiene-1-carboxylate synthase [Solirubrobacter ginsenosidimutans]MDA0163772.1 2-succinyl-6-hydroxy-2,4-cyclohexadiene-1-carboxylate synthase [Solirubrobacter ginsenosidimutans]